MVEKQISKQVKTLRTDNGLEFCNASFDNFFNTASNLVNRSPSTTIGLKTPQEVWSGKPFDYFDLRIFVCPAYAHVNDEGKSPDKFIISRDVTFNESAMLDQSRGCESLQVQKTVVLKQSEPQVEQVKEEDDNTGTRVEDSIAVRKGKRNAPKPARYARYVNTYDIDYVAYALAVGVDIGSNDPNTYKEDVASKDAEHWIITMNEEMQSLEKNKT
ncbi:retrovirus-related pol polyprotein from transposon TNT 1-94 [Tanacetum coccineum]|uniref:Retrovirus-related pol polyprotein from transposon TNT 1-94 n=1 Tax=Tanacetum coccineum TaxID=301880 RepID=A0ABQ5AXB9_9ASTR